MGVVLWRAREGGANLGAREADVEHAGDEHVEVAAGHLAGEPDEGEDGDERRAREAEGELEEVVVEEEVVDHGVAEGDEGHEDAEGDQLPVLLRSIRVRKVRPPVGRRGAAP